MNNENQQSQEENQQFQENEQSQQSQQSQQKGGKKNSKNKSKKGGRKMNNWAKAAGEYYRAHKGDFESFSEVLKSPEFRKYYNEKYGKNKSMKSKPPLPYNTPNNCDA